MIEEQGRISRCFILCNTIDGQENKVNKIAGL